MAGPPTTRAAAGASLAGRLAADMAGRWRRGERPRAEDYLDAHPELRDRAEAAADIIYEEICLRQEHGEEQASIEVLRRFPQWREQLEVLLQFHRLLGPARAAPHFPEVGETLGEFRLEAELGRGASGRVFLAADPSLAGRPVVLKVTPRSGEEHLSLARLQHTHVVPLYAARDDPVRNLRVLCMPYFGGATLARLLAALKDVPPEQRDGADLLRALDEANGAAAVKLPAAGPARHYLARCSYVQAVCWVGAWLADALQHAHDRGLVHLDLKPSNVLLAADGVPMLLDFHLAREPVRAAGPPPGSLGGTPVYMAPEQRAAFAALNEGRPVPADVDARADVYALGLLLSEALGGPVPVPEAGPPRLDSLNPEVSVGLADVLARCLAADPAKRYPSAAGLAADLNRHLADLPLVGVRNRSLAEWWAKWRRRNPYGWLWAAAVLIVALAAGGAWLLWDTDARRIAAEQQQAAAEQRAREEADRTGAVLRLHDLVNYLRFHPESETPGPGWPTLAADCRAAWDKRNLILPSDRAGEDEEALRAELLDLALLWTDADVRRAPQDRAAREAALRVLDEAGALLGPSAALARERRRHAAALGLAGAGDEPPPRTAWDHVAVGRTYLQGKDYAHAAAEFQEAARLQPQGLWPRFYGGVCAERLGRHEEAVLAFTFCTALAAPPRQLAGCLFNRGKAYAAWGRADRALADYDAALELDPTLGAAALNRAVLHYRDKRYADALRDLDLAGERGADPAAVHYNRALVRLGQGDRPRALASVRAALDRDRSHKEARELLESLRPLP
jgi:serine/threonine protein kinase/tetratricopeptide (TPR) repeat protein